MPADMKKLAKSFAKIPTLLRSLPSETVCKYLLPEDLQVLQELQGLLNPPSPARAAVCKICFKPLAEIERQHPYRHHSGECHRIYRQRLYVARGGKIATQEKTCCDCGVRLVPGNYYKSSSSYCKACHSARVKNPKKKLDKGDGSC